MECTCNHADEAETNTTAHKVCGCSHHNGMSTGLLSLSPLKAIFYQVPILLTGSTETLLLQKSETAISVLTKDIFHPPRLIA
jgi:ABC-type iron transport system FetAB permease component